MAPLTRMIDANANRAREALRVVEDLARFVLNDSELCAALKTLRHDLRAALERLPVDHAALVAVRDTPGDVGTGVSTASELERDGAPGLAAANFGRLTEALRAIEEAAKALGAGHSTGFESMRYRAYDLERRLLVPLGTGHRHQPTLCVLLTESLCAMPWLETAKRAIDGGADALQLREKSLDGRE
ncbi:MAG: thiamine phosphate synthase, partial [Phycisphaerales bacterium]